MALDANDTLLLHVQAEQIALRTTHIRWPVDALPPGHARPILAVPVLARRQVVAVALYGQHYSGADLDADEVRVLEKVTDASGAAFDHVEAEVLRRRNADLEKRMRELSAP